MAAEDWAALGLEPERLLVIGVTLEDRDILALDLAHPAEPGECYVVWLAGEKIEEWPSFAECFQSMMAYVEDAVAKGEENGG